MLLPVWIGTLHACPSSSTKVSRMRSRLGTSTRAWSYQGTSLYSASASRSSEDGTYQTSESIAAESIAERDSGDNRFQSIALVPPVRTILTHQLYGRSTSVSVVS